MTEDRDIWVVVEHHNSKLLDVTLEMLEDARKLGDTLREDVIGLALGPPGLPDFSAQLAHHGADRVYLGLHESLERYQTGPFLQVLEKVCHEYRPSNVIIPGSVNGQDLAARLAARLHVGLASFCVSFRVGPEGGVEGIRGIYAEKVYATMACSGKRPHLFTFKPGAAGVGRPDERRAAEVIHLPVDVDPNNLKVKTLGFIPSDPRSMDLTDADLIVSGGRGAGTKETFALLQELADALGTSLGGTRVASDNGWIAQDRLIGLTGKNVAPRLYIAAGISGASYHSLGIKGSENIIAINTDKGAEIFKLAHLAAVGDLKEIIPLLSKKIKKYLADKKGNGSRTTPSQPSPLEGWS